MSHALCKAFGMTASVRCSGVGAPYKSPPRVLAADDSVVTLLDEHGRLLQADGMDSDNGNRVAAVELSDAQTGDLRCPPANVIILVINLSNWRAGPGLAFCRGCAGTDRV